MFICLINIIISTFPYIYLLGTLFEDFYHEDIQNLVSCSFIILILLGCSPHKFLIMFRLFLLDENIIDRVMNFFKWPWNQRNK